MRTTENSSCLRSKIKPGPIKYSFYNLVTVISARLGAGLSCVCHVPSGMLPVSVSSFQVHGKQHPPQCSALRCGHPNSHTH